MTDLVKLRVGCMKGRGEVKRRVWGEASRGVVSVERRTADRRSGRRRGEWGRPKRGRWKGGGSVRSCVSMARTPTLRSQPPLALQKVARRVRQGALALGKARTRAVDGPLSACGRRGGGRWPGCVNRSSRRDGGRRKKRERRGTDQLEKSAEQGKDKMTVRGSGRRRKSRRERIACVTPGLLRSGVTRAYRADSARRRLPSPPSPRPPLLTHPSLAGPHFSTRHDPQPRRSVCPNDRCCASRRRPQTLNSIRRSPSPSA